MGEICFDGCQKCQPEAPEDETTETTRALSVKSVYVQWWQNHVG